LEDDTFDDDNPAAITQADIVSHYSALGVLG